MALPSPYDYPQRPDYIGGVGQAIGNVGKTVEAFSPAHPLIQRALRRIYAGEDPRAVGIEAKLAMSRQQPLPAMPEPATPARAPRAGADDLELFSLVEPSAEGGFTGPREFTGPEEVVTAPRQTPTGSRPLMSAPARQPQVAEASILNKDLPLLMQGARLEQKDEGSRLRELGLELGYGRLRESQRQFDEQASLRAAREELVRAQASGIPERIELARRNLGLRAASIDVAQGNLATRRAENYLRGAGPGLEVVVGMDDLVRQGLSSPQIVGTEFDFTVRRAADVANNLPVLGKFVGSLAVAAVDERLTPAQLEFKQRAAAETSGFIHSRYGSQLTGNELQLANRILGGNLSVASTLSGLMVLRHIANRKVELYQRAYGDVAAQVGYPSDGLPILPEER